MSLCKPYFFIKETDTGYITCHNCDGASNFMSSEPINSNIKHLLEFALAEGERRMAQKMRDLLGVTKC